MNPGPEEALGRDGLPEFQMIGGGRWGVWVATWPLVRMSVFQWGVRIGPSARWLRYVLVPTTDIPWDNIEYVGRRGVAGAMLWFRRRDTKSFVIFGLPLGRSEAFDRATVFLRDHGVTIT